MFHIPDRKVLQDLPISSEETLHSLIVRGEYLLRRSFFHDVSFIHENDPVAEFPCEVDLVDHLHHLQHEES